MGSVPHKRTGSGVPIRGLDVVSRPVLNFVNFLFKIRISFNPKI